MEKTKNKAIKQTSICKGSPKNYNNESWLGYTSTCIALQNPDSDCGLGYIIVEFVKFVF